MEDSTKMQLAAIQEEALEDVVLIDCPKCGRRAPQDYRDKHMCVDCARAENNRYMYIRQHQGDWMSIAREAGIDVWLKQPTETQWEYSVWVAYRDSYPGKRPSFNDVAVQLGTTYNAVKKVAQRWSFQARMQAWMTECDRITLAQRRTEILDMNKAHIDMAQNIRNKLTTAINGIVPEVLKPAEIVALAKLSAELERKARIDTIAQDEIRAQLSTDQNPELRKAPVKKDDLSEIVGILLKTGALGEITRIGVRETKTTEVALMDSDGKTASLEDADE